MRQLKTAFILVLLLTAVTGLIYPLTITLLAQLFFPWQANASLIEKNGQVIGSLYIGQYFNDPAYFWGRPSATSPFPYNASNSAGSNLGPSNPDLIKLVKQRIAILQAANPGQANLIPMDLVTSSASGLDPEISPLAANYQAPRIAKARHLAVSDIQQLILQLTQKRSLHILGEARVNVLQLNLALDQLRKSSNGKAP